PEPAWVGRLGFRGGLGRSLGGSRLGLPGADGRLGDLAAAHAARADENPAHGAVDEGADLLEVRFHLARRHVVGVTDVAAEGRPLAADFTLLGHERFSCWRSARARAHRSPAKGTRTIPEAPGAGKQGNSGPSSTVLTPGGVCGIFRLPGNGALTRGGAAR